MMAASGPYLPFGHATDFAVAANQSGRPGEPAWLVLRYLGMEIGVPV
jgi:hypothetical protein